MPHYLTVSVCIHRLTQKVFKSENLTYRVRIRMVGVVETGDQEGILFP